METDCEVEQRLRRCKPGSLFRRCQGLQKCMIRHNACLATKALRNRSCASKTDWCMRDRG
eukprot:9219566-Heterocapsa_arctica.AAC.1